jgi:hypothetical protein
MFLLYKISVLSVLTVQHLAQMKVTRQILFKTKIKTAAAATLYTFIDCTKVYFDLYLSFSQVTIIITIITTYLQCNVIWGIIIIPSPTKLWRDIVTLPSVLPSVRPSFRNILVNTLESTSFNGFWLNLVHT